MKHTVTHKIVISKVEMQDVLRTHVNNQPGADIDPTATVEVYEHNDGDYTITIIETLEGGTPVEEPVDGIIIPDLDTAFAQGGYNLNDLDDRDKLKKVLVTHPLDTRPEADHPVHRRHS